MSSGHGEAAGPGAWTALGPDRVAFDGFVRVVQRDVRLPDGTEAVWDLRDIPPTVSVLALTEAAEAVLVRQFRPGPDHVVLSLPGGLIDPGESPEEAGRRELREETGHEAAAVRLVATVHHGGDLHPRHTVLATGATPTGVQDLDPLEDIEVVLVPLADLRARLRAGDVGDLGTVEQLYLALDHLGAL